MPPWYLHGTVTAHAKACPSASSSASLGASRASLGASRASLGAMGLVHTALQQHTYRSVSPWQELPVNAEMVFTNADPWRHLWLGVRLVIDLQQH